jgi:hypothetical protein
MAKSAHVPDKHRLKRAQQQEDEARAEYLKRQENVRELLILDQAGKDKELKAIREELRARREEVHRHRLRIGRKKYSVRVKMKSLESQQNALQKLQDEEGLLVQKLEACLKKETAAKNRLVAEIQKQQTSEGPG